MSKRDRERDPLGPIEFFLSLAVGMLVLSAAFLLALVVLQVTGLGNPSLSFGDERTCAPFDTSSGGTFQASGDGVTRAEGIVDFDEDAGSYTTQVWEVCLDDPTTAEAVAGEAIGIPATVGFVGSTILLLRVTRRARRLGLFDLATVREVRRLGRFLMALAILGPVVVAVGAGIVVSAAVPAYDWYDGLVLPDLSWSLLLTAAGVIATARVLSRAAVLQEDVDATI